MVSFSITNARVSVRRLEKTGPEEMEQRRREDVRLISWSQGLYSRLGGKMENAAEEIENKVKEGRVTMVLDSSLPHPLGGLTSSLLSGLSGWNKVELTPKTPLFRRGVGSRHAYISDLPPDHAASRSASATLSWQRITVWYTQVNNTDKLHKHQAWLKELNYQELPL